MIEEGLRGVALPPLTRPDVCPDDDPTEELACWAIAMYVYSSIAHVRTIIAGLLVLTDAGNAPAADIICRHVFEWAAHGCYMNRNLTEHIGKKDWKTAFDLYLKASGGNSWIKNHGHKYGASPIQSEAPDPVRIKKLIAAYDQYQIEQYGESDVKDAYGFLSERVHPNGACFVQYRAISGAQVHFVGAPRRSSRPSVNRSLLEWLVFLHSLLGLAKEHSVRSGILRILTEVTKPAQNAPTPLREQ
jgi:hypothetical protein